jgi:hypothetical protein
MLSMHSSKSCSNTCAGFSCVTSNAPYS